MRSQPLLATLLAVAPIGIPSMAVAFEDMDCIGTEFCTSTECVPSAALFSVEFDWSADAVDLSLDGQDPLRLMLASPGMSSDGTWGHLAFIAPDDGDDDGDGDGAAMILEILGDRIGAMVSLGDGIVQRGQCTAREAA